MRSLVAVAALAVAMLFISIKGYAVEKPTRDMIVAFCEDTAGGEFSEEEVAEIVDYISIPGTPEQLEGLYVVHVRGRLGPMRARNNNSLNSIYGGAYEEVPTYENSCRKEFRAHIRDTYLTPEEQEAKRIEQERREEEALQQEEERRLQAEAAAEAERLRAEAAAEAERLRAEAAAETERLRAEAEADPNDYKLLSAVAPIYPRKAQTRGISGYCVVEFTVTASGTVQNPEAVDCEPKGLFEKASLTAVKKFEYRPRKLEGQAVDVTGVQTTFTYDMN